MIIFRTDQDVEIYVDRKAKEWLDENKRVKEKGGVFMLDTKRDLIISELPETSKYYNVSTSDLIQLKIKEGKSIEV